MSAMVSQITGVLIVHSTVYSDTDQRKHQSFASLAFVRGIHRSPVNSPHKGPVTQKPFPFDDVIMSHIAIKDIPQIACGHEIWNVVVRSKADLLSFVPNKLYVISCYIRTCHKNNGLGFDPQCAGGGGAVLLLGKLGQHIMPADALATAITRSSGTMILTIWNGITVTS